MKNSNQLTPESTIGKASEVIDQGARIFGESTKEYGQKIKEGYEVARDKAQFIGAEVNDFVQKRPLVSLGLAVGAGMLLGRAIKSSTRRT